MHQILPITRILPAIYAVRRSGGLAEYQKAQLSRKTLRPGMPGQLRGDGCAGAAVWCGCAGVSLVVRVVRVRVQPCGAGVRGQPCGAGVRGSRVVPLRAAVWCLCVVPCGAAGCAGVAVLCAVVGGPSAWVAVMRGELPNCLVHYLLCAGDGRVSLTKHRVCQC